MNPNAITTTVKPQTITAAANDFGTKLQIADYLIDSGFLPKALDNRAKVVTSMMMSEELHIGYWQGFNGINIIAGKPTTSPQLMLAMIYQRGNVEDIIITVAEDAATCVMKRRGMTAHTEVFSMDDARKLMTSEWSNGSKRSIPLADKSNWKQQPRVMMKWRAVAACARIVFPDVIMGLYTADEMGADVIYDDGGNETFIVSREPERDPEPPTTPPTPPSSPTPPKNEVPDLAVVERTDITPRDDEPMARVAGAEVLTSDDVEKAKERLGKGGKRRIEGEAPAKKNGGHGAAFGAWYGKYKTSHNLPSQQDILKDVLKVDYPVDYPGTIEQMLDKLRDHFGTREEKNGGAE